MTLNQPCTRFTIADLARTRRGLGTIPSDLSDDGTRISYRMTWPHVRPWRFNPAQPALRAIPDAVKVAAIFTEAAETRISEPRVTHAPATAGHALAAE